VTPFKLRRHGRLPPLSFGVLLQLIRGKNGGTITPLGNPSTLLISVAALRAKIFRWRIVSSTMNLAATVRRRIDVDHVAIVIQLILHIFIRVRLVAQSRIGIASFASRTTR
jgi:hypothetical protein